MVTKRRTICSICASEKSFVYCNYCKKETPSNESVEVFGKHRLRGLFNIKFGGKGRKARSMVRSGWKKSGDSRIINGVYENRIIDRTKNEYHQIVRNAVTGKILHKEHERLNQHKRKK